jgi:phosphoenolpyruvate carboxylase
MFRFIQYIERQIVLFDAVEDAFPIVNNMERGGHRDKRKKQMQRKRRKLIDFLKTLTSELLTAHTQFYLVQY